MSSELQASSLGAPGVHDIPSVDYHAMPAISRSWLKILVKETPADFAWRRNHGIQETDAMRLGTRLHTAVLEPDEYANRYATFPREINRKLGETRGIRHEKYRGRIEWDKAQEQRYRAAMRTRGVEIITEEEMQEDRLVAREVRSRKAVQLLTAGGHAERSLVWQDEKTGLWVKARPDWWDVERGVYVDLKSTNRFDERHLDKSITDHCIDMQFAMVAEGCRALDLPVPTSNVVLWVRTTGRPECRAEALQADVVERGAYFFRKALDLYAECLRTDKWEGEPTTIQPRTLTKWSANYRDEESAA